MTAPENIIIKENGPFYDQPYWVEDYYKSVLSTGGSNHARIAYGPVTDYMRYRHGFPPDSAGIVISFSDPYEPEKGLISGAILDSEQYERFTQFLHNGYRNPDKNNFVLIDDIVATIVHNDLFDKNESLDRLYDLVREAVYKARPNSGPDDVWVDTIIDSLYREKFVDQSKPRTTLTNFFTKTFSDLVYGHHPKPEPTASFIDALQNELEALGYTTPNPAAPTLAVTIQRLASRQPYSPWLREPPPSPLRSSSATIKTLKKELQHLSYISAEASNSAELEVLLSQIIFGTKA